MAKTAPEIDPLDIDRLCDALDKHVDAALVAARRSENPQVRQKLHALIRDQLAETLDAGKKTATIKNRIFKRMTALVGALRGKQDRDTEKLLLELFAQRAKIAKVQGKEPKHDINSEVMLAMASSTEKASDALLAELDAYTPDQFFSALNFALRFCRREKVYAAFHEWLVPPADGPKRKHAKAKAETVGEELELYRNGVLYAKGFRPDMIDADDPNHADRVPPEERLDPRWLDVAIEAELFDLVEGMVSPGHAGAQAWAERRLAENFASKKAPKIRSSKFVKLLLLSEHPRALELYAHAFRHFLATGDGFEAAILLELMPLFPKAAAPQVAAIVADTPEPLIPFRDKHLEQLKNRS